MYHIVCVVHGVHGEVYMYIVTLYVQHQIGGTFSRASEAIRPPRRIHSAQRLGWFVPVSRNHQLHPKSGIPLERKLGGHQTPRDAL